MPPPDASAVRLLATDLDGTLLLPDSTISDRSINALTQAKAAGWILVAATGRPVPLAAHSLSPVIGLVDYIVGGNGREVVSVTAEGRPTLIRRSALTVNQTLTAIGALRTRIPGIRFTVSGILSQAAEPGFAERLPIRVDLNVVDDITEAIERIEDDTVTHIAAFHDDYPASQLTGMISAVVDVPLVAGHAGMDAVDIQPGLIDKGLSVEWLCREIGVPARSVLAFGDWENDRSMLRWAGWGVAMGSADEETQAAANHVTLTNVEDGVAVVIEAVLQGNAAGVG